MQLASGDGKATRPTRSTADLSRPLDRERNIFSLAVAASWKWPVLLLQVDSALHESQRVSRRLLYKVS
jgi:hypothetical protein